MIDVLSEDLLTLRQAARERPFLNSRTGKPTHISGMYRIVQIGATDANGNRVRLEVVRTPSGLRTTRQAIVRFIQALTGVRNPAILASQSKSRRDAQGILEGAGI